MNHNLFGDTMVNKKMLIIISVFLALVVFMGSASAANDENATVGTDEVVDLSDEILTVEESSAGNDDSGLELEGNVLKTSNDNENIGATVTVVGNTFADIQSAIDSASPNDIIRLGNYNYTNVSNINITKDLSIVGSEGTTVTSSGDGSPIFNIPAKSEIDLESVNITGIEFKLNSRDIVVKAIAINDTEDSLYIDVPTITITDNVFETADEDVVPESVNILCLESESRILSPTNEITISNNIISAGMDPFDFKVTSIGSGENIDILPQNLAPQKQATVIVFNNMSTTALGPSDGRTGDYFYFNLTDINGKPIANAPMQIGFNGKVYDYEHNNISTNENGTAKLQINLGYKGDYTFAICFLGNEDYNASFAVAVIKVSTQKPTLNVPNKSYKANAKTKTLTATFNTEKGNPIAGKKVTFTVNGKNYSAKTDENGVATVNVSLNKKGTYNFMVKYGGDSTYAAVSQKAKLTIK